MFSKENTLSVLKGYALKRPQSFDVPCSEAAARINHVMKTQGWDSKKTSPEDDALLFYLLNHGVAVLQERFGEYDNLGEHGLVVDAYLTLTPDIFYRAFYYLLLISTGEIRHAKPSMKASAGTKSQFLKENYGSEISDFICGLSGNSRSGAFKIFLDNPPKATLGHYLHAVMSLFYKGSFGGGFGGKAWGMIAETLYKCVVKETSPETFIDTSYTLSHNNGPIYNKGVIYSMYSSELIKILDVQRSGQVPQLILNHELSFKASGMVTDFAKSLGELFPEFKAPVDWAMVNALGSKKKYHVPGNSDGTQVKKTPILKPEPVVEDPNKWPVMGNTDYAIKTTVR